MIYHPSKTHLNNFFCQPFRYDLFIFISTLKLFDNKKTLPLIVTFRVTKVLPNKPIKLPVTTWSPLYQRLTRTILFGTAVTKKRAILGIADVMALVAHFGTNSTHPDALDHLARVTVVPVLVHELPLCGRERAQPGIQLLLIARLLLPNLRRLATHRLRALALFPGVSRGHL